MLVDMMKLTILAVCCLALAGTATLGAQSSAATAAQDQPSDGRAGNPAASGPASSAPPTNPPPRISPEQRLEAARGALATVPEKSMPTRARKAFAQLQKDFAALASSYRAHPEADAWTLSFSDVERDLAPLIGVGPVATPIQDANMPDAATRALIGAFRANVELFYDAASTARESGGAAAPPAHAPAP
jgi:hypothetical protein